MTVAGEDRAYALGPDGVVVRLSDHTVREAIHDLRWRLDEMLAAGPSTVVVDVTGLTRLSSPTIAALLWAKRRCAARGVQLVLGGPDQVLLQRACLDGLFRTQDVPPGPDATEPAGTTS